ncbi:MAG: double-strand break repair protein AddB, partial [Pseudomonadota bacterium]
MEGRLISGYRPADDPLLLPEATIYMPNRRAARALSTAFIDWFGGRATLLPLIRTLGDTDDRDFGLSPADDDESLVLPPIGDLDRVLQLARLVQGWKDAISRETRALLGDEEILIPTSHADSIRLAHDLAGLLSQMTQEEVEWNRVDDVVPDDHADWWRLTSTFLRIVMEAWPAYLEDTGLLDPADRAVRLLKARAERYARDGSRGPVIVAGSTGSVPSTQLLLKAVAGLPNGAVILPGVDLTLGAREWERLGRPSLLEDPLVESHPQFGLARTLANIGSARENVVELGQPKAGLKQRAQMVATALSLSDFSADWLDLVSTIPADDVSAAFAGVSLIEAINERQEALALAIALRETLNDPSKTAALVTPDRQLARRVSMELERFNLQVDDSGGEMLAQTPVAQLARKLAQVTLGTPTKSDLVNFIKDPLARAAVSSKPA